MTKFSTLNTINSTFQDQGFCLILAQKKGYKKMSIIFFQNYLKLAKSQYMVINIRSRWNPVEIAWYVLGSTLVYWEVGPIWLTTCLFVWEILVVLLLVSINTINSTFQEVSFFKKVPLSKISLFQKGPF